MFTINNLTFNVVCCTGILFLKAIIVNFLHTFLGDGERMKDKAKDRKDEKVLSRKVTTLT